MQKKTSITTKYNKKMTWFPLILLVILFFAFFYFDCYQYLTFNMIKHYQAVGEQWARTHYHAAVSLYIGTFIILIACAIPCATILTLLGGFLFGNLAVFYALFSITGGGALLYGAVRTSLGTCIAERSHGWIKKMEHGFQKDAFHYLLMLRLIPIFPCWISNIAAGALNVPFSTFISATLLGIAPSTFVYTMAGKSLDKLISDEPTPFFTLIFTPSILFPLLGLVILSLFPIFYKYFKKNL